MTASAAPSVLEKRAHTQACDVSNHTDRAESPDVALGQSHRQIPGRVQLLGAESLQLLVVGFFPDAG